VLENQCAGQPPNFGPKVRDDIVFRISARGRRTRVDFVVLFAPLGRFRRRYPADDFSKCLKNCGVPCAAGRTAAWVAPTTRKLRFPPPPSLSYLGKVPTLDVLRGRRSPTWIWVRKWSVRPVRPAPLLCTWLLAPLMGAGRAPLALKNSRQFRGPAAVFPAQKRFIGFNTTSAAGGCKVFARCTMNRPDPPLAVKVVTRNDAASTNNPRVRAPFQNPARPPLTNWPQLFNSCSTRQSSRAGRPLARPQTPVPGPNCQRQRKAGLFERSRWTGPYFRRRANRPFKSPA